MKLFKKLFLHSFKHYMIALGAIVGLVIIFMWIDKFNLKQYPSAFVSAGLLVTFTGLLLLLGYLGAYDTLGYAFTTFKTRSRRPYKDLVEYSEVKQRARKLKDYFFVPYIVVGLIVFAFGMVNWFFTKPLDKLSSPSNVVVTKIDENKFSITFDKNEQAVNGYVFEIKEEYESVSGEIPDNLYNISEAIAQPDSDKVTFEITIPDVNKRYKVSIICLAVKDKYNGSDKTSIYVPE